MDIKRKVIIAAIIVIALIVLWVVIFLDKPTEIAPNPADSQNSAVDSQVLDQIDQLPQPSEATMDAEQNYSLGLKQLAFSFAERFGSYSSDGGLKSLRDLKPLSTTRMQQNLDSIIARNSSGSNNYEAVATKSLSSNLLELNESAGRATILVKTQKSSYLNDNNPVVSYEDLLLKFVLNENTWEVDDADWQ